MAPQRPDGSPSEVPNPRPPLVLGDLEDLVLREAMPASFQAVASGGQPAYVFEALGLPPGLNLAPDSGRITGRPLRAGEFSTAISVRDSLGTRISRSVGIVVVASLTVNVLPRLHLLPEVRTTLLLAFPNGGLPPYTVTATGFPRGLGMSVLNTGMGLLLGSAKEAGTATIQITVQDAARQIATGSCLLRVSPDGFWVEVGMSTLAVRERYDQQICRARGGHPWRGKFYSQSYEYSVSGLPSGISVLPFANDHVMGANQTGSLVSGIANEEGRYLVSATAFDASGTLATGYGYLLVGPGR